MTIAQAARACECPESAIEYAIRQGRIAVLERRAPRSKFLIDPLEVDTFARARKLGRHGRSLRRIVCAHFAADSEPVVALRAAGLHVEVEPTVLAALSAHDDNDTLPVLVVPAELPIQEIALLRTLSKHMHLVVVGEVNAVDGILAHRGNVVHEWELRRLVQLAWAFVERRTE
jgi:CBS domain-containing protein